MGTNHAPDLQSPLPLIHGQRVSLSFTYPSGLLLRLGRRLSITEFLGTTLASYFLFQGSYSRFHVGHSVTNLFMFFLVEAPPLHLGVRGYRRSQLYVIHQLQFYV